MQPTKERREPSLGSIEELDTPSRIPTLTEPATREAPPVGADSDAESEAISGTAPIGEEDIEALADRVLDQLAPALREAVAAALDELLAERGLLRR